MRVADSRLENGVVWAELSEDDVLIGYLDPDFRCRLGYDPDALTLYADLNVAPDVTGKIILRVPDEVTPEYPEDLRERVDIWEPEVDAGGHLIGARGYLRYRPFQMPWGEYHLEITTEECPFHD